MAKLVIGVDYGTDSVRALLVNAENGEELGSCVHHYERWKHGRYCDPVKNQFRQHPLDYLNGLEITIRGVLAKAPAGAAKNVIGISVDTTGSTPVAVNKDGVPLSMTPGFEDNPNAMFILWKDHTAMAEAGEINQYAKTWGGEDYTKYEGGIYSSEWFWSKILHTLRSDKQVRQAAFSWVEHCDWIPAVLAGSTDPLKLKRSRCAAGHKAMWHERWGGLPAEEFLSGVDPLLSGLRARLFTKTFTSETKAGALCAEWSKKLGLQAGIAIGVGAFDCHFGAVGGQIEPYYLSKVMGTSTCDLLVAPLKDLDGKLIRGICGQVDGSIIPGMLGMEAGQSAFGDIYAWFKNLIAWPLQMMNQEDAEKIAAKILPALEKEAMKIPVGESSVLALDWMNGRRTPDANQSLKGAILGLNLGSSAPMIYRALVEATVFGTKKIADRFTEEGIPVKGIIAMGGVAKKSPFIMQMCADVLEMPVKIVKSEQACALGAAMFAAVAGGQYKNVQQAMKKMGGGFDKTYEPVAESSRKYAECFKQYSRYAVLVEKETMRKK